MTTTEIPTIPRGCLMPYSDEGGGPGIATAPVQVLRVYFHAPARETRKADFP